MKFNSKQQNHTYKLKKEKEVATNNILTGEEEKNLAISLIKANIYEPPSFQINNLNANKIHWPNKKFERLVYKLQEIKFPSNKLFLGQLNKTYIYLGDNNIINKYKNDIGFKIISQLEKDEEEDLKRILFSMLDILFDIKCENDLEDIEDIEYIDSNDNNSDNENVEVNSSEDNKEEEDFQIYNLDDEQKINSIKEKLEKLSLYYYSKILKIILITILNIKNYLKKG